MSLLRKPKSKRVGSLLSRLCDSLFCAERGRRSDLKSRRLLIDQLEERALLSVTMNNVDQVMINQVTNSFGVTAQSVASDHNGDFVVVYTRTDPVLNADGTQATDPASGALLSGTNVYARYFTNEVQRIVLPASVLDADPTNSSHTAKFSLEYGGNEIQQINFSQSPATALDGAFSVGPISGTFSMWLDVNGDGVQDPDEVTALINFDETNILTPQWSSPTTSALDDATTTIKVQSVAGLPGFDFPYSISIGNEHMLVTGVDAANNELTVVRGAGGTTATAHDAGGVVLLLNNDGQMQDALRELGGDLADVTITAVSPKQYNINFGDASGGRNQPQLSVVNPTWFTGFLPAATMSTLREKVEVGVNLAGDPQIPVSRTNPNLTAAAMQTYFNQYMTYYIGPVFSSGMPGGPATASAAVPSVTVTPVKTADDPEGLRTFDITFVGNSSYQDVPLLVVPDGQIVGAAGTVINALATVTTRKEPSPEFRVNPEVPANGFVTMPESCSSPAVAMDADGNFVITWAAQVSNLINFGSNTDVFARRFEPVGIVSEGDPVLGPGIWMADMNNDGIPETEIQGVRPLVTPMPYDAIIPDDLQVPGDYYTFLVNTSTTNAQGNPAVAMDLNGNFIITWSDTGQTLSFFNDIKAQQYTRDGAPNGGEMQISNETTNRNDNSYVAMSQDGHWLVVWENWLAGQLPMEIDASLYSAQGVPMSGQFTVESNAIGPTAAFDGNNNFVISWAEPRDVDNMFTSGLDTMGIYMREYALNGQVIRSDFRGNSASINPATNPNWPHAQSGAQVVMDIDGDLTVSYSGFGPDVAEAGASGAATALMYQMLNRPENADLLDAINNTIGQLQLPLNLLGTDYDPDSEIEEVLILMQSGVLGQNLNVEQLGRLNAIMNAAVGLTRGDPNAVMYSQFDANPNLGPQNVLGSDNVVNATRDGTNYRTTLTLDFNVTSGSFQLLVVGPGGAQKVVTIDPVYTPGDPPLIDPAATAQVIQSTLSDPNLREELGMYWPDQQDGGQNSGPVIVRLMAPVEVAVRNGMYPGQAGPTYWELLDPMGNPINPNITYTYEIYFLGESHESSVGLIPISSSLMDTDFAGGTYPAAAPLMIDETFATPGTTQTAASIAMTPDGSFTYVWTQYETDSTGLATNGNLYFRTFNESQNTAGPQVAKVSTPDQSIIDPGSQIYTTDGLRHVVVSFDQEMNNAVLTANLNANVSASATTISVKNFGTFPTSGPFTVIVGQEHMRVVGGFGTGTWQVTRGVENTTAVAHNANASVVLPFGNVVTNPANYQLMLGGVPINGAITHVDYGLSEASQLARNAVDDPANWASYSDLSLLPTNRWEVVLTIDGNGTQIGDPLLVGSYTLKMLTPQTAGGVSHSGLTDKGGKALGANGFTLIDGDTTRAGLDYIFSFQVSTGGTPATGTEFLVNQNPEYRQILGVPYGIGTAQERNPRTVAIDDKGDFAVVWESYGQDGDPNPTLPDGSANPNFDPNAATSTGVYTRLFDGNNNPLTPEIQVNTYTIGNQSDGTIAMDADGDFVVVWASDGQDPDGSSGIYGQRFDSMGRKLGTEFRVNSNTPNDQVTPGVAMDAAGNFVVVWATQGQTLGYSYDIHAQLYNYGGNRVGSEFLVNMANDPGRDGWEQHPAVAMNSSGEFIVAWEDVTHVYNGVEADTEIWGRLFNPDGTPHALPGSATDAFRMDLGIGQGGTGTQRTAQPFRSHRRSR